MDFGKVAWDGNRLLGDGKTWRGFAGGIASGTLLGVMQAGVALLLARPSYAFGEGWELLILPLSLSIGGLLGDLLGAFTKRRLGLPKGARAPGLDQYDFILGAFIIAAVVRPHWLAAHYLIGEAFFGLLAVLVLTPILHRGANVIGHRMGKKEVPW